MKYKIAVCNDSAADRQYVLHMVGRWAAEAGHAVHADAFASAESFLFRYAQESDYDILLLDIEMGAMDGVSLAKQLRQSNDAAQIVFITGYGDYIAEGYEVAALHYLMKPVKEEKLRCVLDRAAEIQHGAKRLVHGKARLDHGRKKVIVLSLLCALTAVALNLIELCLAPAVLSVVERHASATESTIGVPGFLAPCRQHRGQCSAGQRDH